MSDGINFCNRAELNTREASWLVFYAAHKFTYNNNLRGVLPAAHDYDFKVRVNDVSSFVRDIKSEKREHNHYYAVRITARYYPIADKQLAELQALQADNAYVVLLITNSDAQVFGNAREPMSMHVHDHVRDDGSGQDYHVLEIAGDTTMRPAKQELGEVVAPRYFKVLLYTNPIR
ncbi:MAG: hypothetical protein Q4F57_06000 [Weeksellaceae bacterium]|nr:hypothetical protein [Weeksellaceae bacterium]